MAASRGVAWRHQAAEDKPAPSKRDTAAQPGLAGPRGRAEVSAATAVTARAALPVPARILEKRLCALPVPRATPAPAGGSPGEIRILHTPRNRGTWWDGARPGLCKELSVPLVLQISNVSFFVLSPALLYLNRQYCQKKALPLYFVSGLLLLVGGCQGCGKTTQVARLPNVRPWEGLSGQSTGKTWVGKQSGLFEACSPWFLRWMCSFQPCKSHGVSGLTQSGLLEHQNPCMPCSSVMVCPQEMVYLSSGTAPKNPLWEDGALPSQGALAPCRYLLHVLPHDPELRGTALG